MASYMIIHLKQFRFAHNYFVKQTANDNNIVEFEIKNIAGTAKTRKAYIANDKYVCICDKYSLSRNSKK